MSQGLNNELEETSQFFETAIVADTVVNSLVKDYKTTIFVFTKSKVDIDQRLKREIKNQLIK